LATEEIKKRLRPEYANELLAQPKEEEEEIEQFEFPDKSFFNKPSELEKGQASLNQGQKALNPGQKMLNTGQAMLNPGQKMLPEPVGESSTRKYLTSEQLKALNDKYFKDTSFDVVFTIERVVLREVSTSGLDSGRPSVTLKLSTGMVDTLDGKPINSWNGFKVIASGHDVSITIDNTGDMPISKIVTFDPVENVSEAIFKTIPPSLILEFAGDKVAIESFTNRSSQVAIRSAIDFENLFEPQDKSKSKVELPEEGEETTEDNKESEETQDSVNK
jgi:hypothetical protein